VCVILSIECLFTWREALWYTLLLNNINGKMYRLILNMYDNIKSCVVYNYCKSDFFRCENGVRQVENLSPFLFSIFLNDLESYLQSKDVSGLTTLSETTHDLMLSYIFNIKRYILPLILFNKSVYHNASRQVSKHRRM
jgi:hypothetical protein